MNNIKIKESYEKLINQSSVATGRSTFQATNIWHDPPASSDSPGEEGWMSYDANYRYIYTNGQWLRHSLSEFGTF